MFIEDKADGYVEYEDSHGNMFLTENEEAKKASSSTQVTKGGTGKKKSKLNVVQAANANKLESSMSNI